MDFHTRLMITTSRHGYGETSQRIAYLQFLLIERFLEGPDNWFRCPDTPLLAAGRFISNVKNMAAPTVPLTGAAKQNVFSYH